MPSGREYALNGVLSGVANAPVAKIPRHTQTPERICYLLYLRRLSIFNCKSPPDGK
jgi:hypothetical protein